MEYSVIIPVYNSERSLEELLQRLATSFANISSNYEIIFVDDCSRDDSWEKLKELEKKSDVNVSIIQLSKNFGQHNAIVCGVLESSGKTVITMDDDLEHPPEEIEGLIKTFKEKDFDLLYGLPKNQHKGIFRRMSSSLSKFMARKFGKGFGEGSGFRIIKSELAQKLKHHDESFIFIDEIFYWYSNNFGTSRVNFDKRKYGASNYSKGDLFKLQFNNMMNYSISPLRLMMYLGFAIAAFSFILGTLFIIKKFIYDTPQGYTSLVVIILFSTGTILVSLGYVGEYIGKMFKIMHNEPQFSVKEKIKCESRNTE